MMGNVTELLVRGDTNVCGGGGDGEDDDGDGREVVYLQNVTMRLPKRGKGEERETIETNDKHPTTNRN